MKVKIIFLAILLTSFIPTYSQTTSIEKTIKIEEDNGETIVTITTVQNGKKTTEVLEGKEAEDYAKSSNSTNDEIVNIKVTKEDLKKIERQVEDLTLKLNDLIIELNEMPVDTAIHRIDVQVDKAKKCIKESVGCAY